MKNITITINGKEYTAQMSDEAVKEITEEKKRTGYERLEKGYGYWCAKTDGDISTCFEESTFAPKYIKRATIITICSLPRIMQGQTGLCAVYVSGRR